MASSVQIEGITYHIEKRPDGCLLVRYAAGQFNAMHGPETDGPQEYIVHPSQRHQFDLFNAQLPAAERVAVEPRKDENRPWWSFGAGHSGGTRE